MPHTDQALLGTGGDRERANVATHIATAREHAELGEATGPMVRRPPTGRRSASANADHLANVEIVALRGRECMVVCEQHLLALAHTPELRKRLRRSSRRTDHQHAETEEREHPYQESDHTDHPSPVSTNRMS